jgi:hypothetical protein
MRNDLKSRIVAIVVLGMLGSAYMQHDYHRWSERGRDAFIVFQNQRFDRYIASPRPFLFTAVGVTVFVCVFIGIYEFIVRTVSSLLGAEDPGVANK